MGPEDVSEKMEWEARRVAAAFGATDFVLTPQFHSESTLQFELPLESEVILCVTLSLDPVVSVGLIELMGGDAYIFMARAAQGRWDKGGGEANRKHHNRMACGLYCFGVEDEAILTQLPPLSAHEKLELRLSMPREFWPQKWLDEEKGRAFSS